jgi:hypothetical protein
VAKQKERKAIFLEGKFSIVLYVDNMGTHISSLKWLGLSVSAVNMVVRNHHVIEGNANQCGRYQVIF